jgi:TonB family protein
VIRLACVAAALLPLAATADEGPADLSARGEWGRLWRIVRPEYPPEALARGQVGTVHLEGTVRADGFIDDYVYRPDRPESEIFVVALKKVTRDWVFVPPMEADCTLSRKPASVDVSFEIDAGTPRIFVTHQRTLQPRPTLPYMKPTYRVQPEYPYRPLRSVVMADVFSRVVVDRSGKVVNVRAHAYTPQKVDPDFLESFTTNAESALYHWEFPPVPEGSEAPWTACYHFRYRIRQ